MNNNRFKERAWNNLNIYGAGFLLLTKQSQEAHSCSTQRLRWFRQEQKDQSECSSYFIRVPKQCKDCLVPVSNQSGTALVTSLVMLLIMTMIGVASLKNTLMQEKMAGNAWDAGAAFQATEIGLRDAENYIETQTSASKFSTTATPTVGLLSATATEFDYLDTAAWNSGSAIQSSGEFTAVKEPPYHVIKHIKDTSGPGGNYSPMVRGYGDEVPGTNVSIFKITAKGSGRTDSARSILQTYYAKRF